MSGGAAPRRDGPDPAEPAMLDLTGWRPGRSASDHDLPAPRSDPDRRADRITHRVPGPRFVLHRGGRVRRRS